MLHLLFPPNTKRIIQNLPPNADVLATVNCLKQLGVTTNHHRQSATLTLTSPKAWPSASTAPLVLNAQNSGTTLRLMSGLLSGFTKQPIQFIGDASLSQRPMKRIIEPLTQMNALITGTVNPSTQKTTAPITIQPITPHHLKPITYTLPVASAQVKSAILLAGCFASGKTTGTTTVIEPEPTRDHTERMLNAMGVSVNTHADQNGAHHVAITGPIDPATLTTTPCHVAGDISSAAFLMIATLLSPQSKLTLTHVGLNPSRTGVLDVLKKWHGQFNILNEGLHHGEPVGDIVITACPLSGDVSLDSHDIPALVDELPILAIAASFCEGTFTVRGAEELRHKECDRLKAIETLLTTVGLPITMYADGFTIAGSANPPVQPPKNSDPLPTYHDHRIALCWSVLNYLISPHQQWVLDHPECINVSFPNFKAVLVSLTS